MQELSITNKNIDEVAIDSGFPNSHAFVTLLKKEYGMLPKEYRREQKKEKQPVMISLCLSDIPQGNYKISETYVNRTHGRCDKGISSEGLSGNALWR